MYASTILQTYKGFSPKDVYKFHCEKSGVKEISEIRDSLPGAIDDFGSVKELDLSACLLGDNGCYSVLETVRALYGLEVLRLTGTNLTNAISKMLAQVAVAHPTLQVIDIGDNAFLSAPCGDLFLEVARKAPGILRVGLSGTNIPPDLVRKIQLQLQANVKCFLTTGDPEAVHTFLLEAAVYEVLEPHEKDALRRTVRSERLDATLRSSAPPPIELVTEKWLLPRLSKEDVERAGRCFRAEDTNDALLLSFPKVVDCLRRYGIADVDRDDPFLVHVYSKMDLTDEGLLGSQEWLLLLQNYLLYAAANVRHAHHKQLRVAYDLAGTGADTTAVHASACISNLSNITGYNLPDSLEDKVQNILVASSGLATTDESLIPMTFDTFAEAATACECLVNRSLRDAVVLGKYYEKHLASML